VNEVDAFDSTPTYYAAFGGHEAIVRLLLANGAVADPGTFVGERCLYGALTDAIKALLKAHSATDFSAAARHPFARFLRSLADRAADDDCDDDDDRVAFCFAGRRRRPQAAAAPPSEAAAAAAADPGARGDDKESSSRRRRETTSRIAGSRVVLAARSPALRAKFLGAWRSKREVRLQKAPASASVAVLRYALTGRLVLRASDAREARRVARALRLGFTDRASPLGVLAFLDETVARLEAAQENCRDDGADDVGTRRTTLSPVEMKAAAHNRVVTYEDDVAALRASMEPLADAIVALESCCRAAPNNIIITAPGDASADDDTTSGDNMDDDLCEEEAETPRSSSSSSSGLSRLAELACDATLECADGRVRAPSAFLRAHSAVLDAALSSAGTTSFAEARTRVFRVGDVSRSAAAAIVRWAVCGTCAADLASNPQLAADVLVAAHRLLFPADLVAAAAGALADALIEVGDPAAALDALPYAEIVASRPHGELLQHGGSTTTTTRTVSTNLALGERLYDAVCRVCADRLDRAVRLDAFRAAVVDSARSIQARQATDSIPFVDDIRQTIAARCNPLELGDGAPEALEEAAKLELIDALLDDLGLAG